MNPLLVLIFVIFLFAGLFFSLYILLKSVFSSVQEGLNVQLSDVVLGSPPGAYDSSGIIFISVIFAAILSVIIIILVAAWKIKKKTMFS